MYTPNKRAAGLLHPTAQRTPEEGSNVQHPHYQHRQKKMTATVETVFLYQALCHECGAGSVLSYESEDDALEWAATHDAENHAEDDGNDEAYEKYREARHGD